MHNHGVLRELELWWKAALLVGLATLAQQASTAPAMAQTLHYSRDPGTVVASYRLQPGELAGDGTGPSVQIHGDGRALVHVPHYRKDSGDYSTRLSPAEMDSLIASLVANGVLDFDPVAVKQAIREARLNRGSGASEVLTESTDPPITTIELRVRRSSTSATGTGGAAAEVAKTVRWAGLQNDAQQFADIAAIRKLAAASQRLEAVMQRADLQRIQQ
jgi:hypothetical protein